MNYTPGAVALVTMRKEPFIYRRVYVFELRLNTREKKNPGDNEEGAGEKRSSEIGGKRGKSDGRPIAVLQPRSINDTSVPRPTYHGPLRAIDFLSVTNPFYPLTDSDRGTIKYTCVCYDATPCTSARVCITDARMDGETNWKEARCNDDLFRC